MALVKVHYSSISENSLSHYGVKGMKWGVRNEETLARYLRDGISMPEFAGGGGGVLDDPLDAANDEEILNNLDFWKIKEGESTPDQDMLAINPYYNQGVTDLEEWAKNDPFGITYAASVNNSWIDEEGYSAYTFNCVACSMLYDLRRRGFDVDANGTTNMAQQFKTGGFSDYYMDAKPKEYTYVDDVYSEMKKTPKGARGILGGTTVNGGGHAIAWENEGEGGVTFRDCQTGKKYSPKTIDKLFSTNEKNKPNKPVTDEKNLWYVRIDDKRPNYARLRKDGVVSTVKNNKEETEKDRIRSISGYYNIKKREENRKIQEYEKTIKNEKERKRLTQEAKDAIYSYQIEEEERIKEIKKRNSGK